MAEITAAAVKDLRERSGAGMMDCKKALTETNGDMEAAIDWLRTKGLATPPRSPAAPRPRAWSALPSRAPRARRRGQFRDRLRRQERAVPGLRPRRDAARAETGDDRRALGRSLARAAAPSRRS
jgi:hypothetical protein